MAFRTPLVLCLGAAALVLAGVIVFAQQGPAATARTKTPVASVLPPLPNPGYAPARPMEVTRQAYEFAAKNPDVIKYVPCYCGCERNGHHSNESCFVRSRDAKGRVTWDTHGWGCTICIDVAVEAARMHALGASPASIRTAMDRKYKSQFPTSTPTPRPPAGHSH